jgi:hypothetical protein
MPANCGHFGQSAEDATPALPQIGKAALTPRSIADIVQARAITAGLGRRDLAGHSLKRGALRRMCTRTHGYRRGGKKACTCARVRMRFGAHGLVHTCDNAWSYRCPVLMCTCAHEEGTQRHERRKCGAQTGMRRGAQ